MNELQASAIRKYLEENGEERLSVCFDINCYDGSMDFCDTWDLEELCNCTEDTLELVRSIVYGEVNNITDDVRYNAYGNLESISNWSLLTESASYIDEIIEFIELNGIGNLSDSEIKEIMESDEYKHTCPFCNTSYDNEDEMEECYNDCKEDEDEEENE